MNFNSFEVSSSELAQGLPEGYVYSIGPLDPMNINFQIDLNFEVDNYDETTVALQGVLQGRSGDEEWRTLKQLSVNSKIGFGEKGKITLLIQ